MPTQEEISRTVDTDRGKEVYAGKWAKQVLLKETDSIEEDELALGHYSHPIEGELVASIPYSSLLRGMLITGSSGYGKSQLVNSLLIQMAEDGYGFCHIDSKDSCKDILQRLPEDRMEDVILLGSFDRKILPEVDPTQLESIEEDLDEVQILHNKSEKLRVGDSGENQDKFALIPKGSQTVWVDDGDGLKLYDQDAKKHGEIKYSEVDFASSNAMNIWCRYDTYQKEWVVYPGGDNMYRYETKNQLKKEWQFVYKPLYVESETTELPTDKMVNGFNILETPPTKTPRSTTPTTVANVLHANRESDEIVKEVQKAAADLAIQRGVAFPNIADVLSHDPDNVDLDYLGPLMDKILKMENDHPTIEAFHQSLVGLTDNPHLTKSIANPSPVSIYDAIQPGNIVLVGAGDYQYETRNQYIGALLNKILEVLQVKGGLDEMFGLSIDEGHTIDFERYELKDLFSKSRSWNIGLLTSLQYMAQMTPETKRFVLNNFPNLVCFNPQDVSEANILSQHFNLESRDELTSLHRYTTISNLDAKYDNAQLKFRTFAPLEPRREEINYNQLAD